jgi:hypothetical protein
MSELPKLCSHGIAFGKDTECPACDAIWKERMMSNDERLLKLSFEHLGAEYEKLKQQLAQREEDVDMMRKDLGAYIAQMREIATIILGDMSKDYAEHEPMNSWAFMLNEFLVSNSSIWLAKRILDAEVRVLEEAAEWFESAPEVNARRIRDTLLSMASDRKAT